MSYLKCGRNGNVDKWHTYTGDETETSTNAILKIWTKRKRWQMPYLPTETSTNVELKMWTKRKRRQMSYLKCGRNGNVDQWHTYTGDETETSTNVKLTNVNETETSTNVILKIWRKRKRWQLSYLHGERNGNVDKCHTCRRKRRQMSNLKCERNGNVDKCHT